MAASPEDAVRIDYFYEELEAGINGTLSDARSLGAISPSRELSLVITKLEEAQLWFTKVA